MRIFVRRLENKGYSVRAARRVTAKSREGTINISSSGLCWSSFDPADAVLPAIPDALSFPKEPVPLRTLKAMYFETARIGGRTMVRLSTRLEFSFLWDQLRASGRCGLTPDESAVASLFIRKASGDCELLADFPTEGAVPRICGRMRYFDSSIDNELAASTLRVIGERATFSTRWANGVFSLPLGAKALIVDFVSPPRPR
jgi:hypothetical protein